ncbi:hypothetical protein [Thermococcus sp.]
MAMLKDIARLDEGRIMITGNGKRLARIYLDAWLRRGRRGVAEYLPFQINGEMFIGPPFESEDFDVYLIVNPLSKSVDEKERLYRWLEEHPHKLVLLYETKYVADSITRYRIRQFIDYLIAYKWETAGFERIDVMKLEEGRVVERKTYVRRR